MVNVLASIDWSQPVAYNALELVRRLGLLCLFVVGASLAAIRSVERHDVDGRPAPWVRTAALVALALFLLHNLIDFSLFEPGLMFLFMFLCGSTWHVTEVRARSQAGRNIAGRRAAFIAGTVAWLTILAAFAVPVLNAEWHADAGDEALRTLQFGHAATEFEAALDTVPYNSDYAFRAARAVLADPRPADPGLALRMLDRAIALDPNRPLYFLHRANARLRSAAPDVAAVRADYERALRLDPNNVDARLEYADVLRRFGDNAAAAGQYREALRFNNLLSPDEPKRLTPQRVTEVERSITELSGGK
jgi:tetratricopeptide (TPR) repeat protein